MDGEDTRRESTEQGGGEATAGTGGGFDPSRKPRLAPGEFEPRIGERPTRLRVFLWSLPAWAILVLLWWLAIEGNLEQLAASVALWAVCVVFWAVVLTAWVAHNRNLAHRMEEKRGGRKGAPDVPLVIEDDALGRKMEVPEGADRAREIAVFTMKGRKVFTVIERKPGLIDLDRIR